MARSNKFIFWGFWLLLSGLWLVFNTDIFSAANLFAFRKLAMQFTGTLAIAAMSIAMILSLRWHWTERLLGGLDKSYRIHKWLGIGALGLSVIHWLWAEAPKWAIGWGLLERPVRPERGAGGPAEMAEPLRAFLLDYRHTAEELAGWAIYIVIALLVIALLRLVPYRYFRYTHKIMPAIYLVLALHSFVLFDYDMWLTPLGLIMGVLLVTGTYAAIVSLTGQIGRARKLQGTITHLQLFPGVRALETLVNLGSAWKGHKAGQFAFATSSAWEGAHPYTIASAWDPKNPTIRFVTKELGDHTTGLAQRLRVGQRICIEGPYGNFTFDDNQPRQIWVGGGIGITPFIARMKELANLPEGAPRPHIDLFHTTREVDEAAFDRLMSDAADANIALHLMIDERDGCLTGDRIREVIPEWQEASLWFCGPAPFGEALRKDFAKAGLNTEKHFHQELFEMR